MRTARGVGVVVVGLEVTCNEVMTHYCMLFPTIPQASFLLPSLVDLAMYWQDVMRMQSFRRTPTRNSCNQCLTRIRPRGRWRESRRAAEINEAARALFSSTLVRMPPTQLATIVSYWMRYRKPCCCAIRETLGAALCVTVSLSPNDELARMAGGLRLAQSRTVIAPNGVSRSRP